MTGEREPPSQAAPLVPSAAEKADAHRRIVAEPPDSAGWGPTGVVWVTAVAGGPQQENGAAWRSRCGERGAGVKRRRNRRDDQAVADVLADLRELHLRLSSDLSAVSGAVENDAPTVAADILTGDHSDLQGFLARAERRLADGEPAAPPVPQQRGAGRRGWRRSLPALPAIAVLAGAATAAAIVAPHLGSQDGSGQDGTSTLASRPSESIHTSDAGSVGTPASFEQLRHAIVGHAPAHAVLAAAQRWHRQLAVLIATAGSDPQRLDAVVVLLHREQQLLAHHRSPELQAVIAAASRLERHLLETAAPLLSELPMPQQSLLPSLPALVSPPPHHRPSAQPEASSSTPPSSPQPSIGKSHPTHAHSPSTPPSSPPATPTSPPSWTPPWQPTSPNQWVFDQRH